MFLVNHKTHLNENKFYLKCFYFMNFLKIAFLFLFLKIEKNIEQNMIKNLVLLITLITLCNICSIFLTKYEGFYLLLLLDIFCLFLNNLIFFLSNKTIITSYLQIILLIELLVIIIYFFQQNLFSNIYFFSKEQNFLYYVCFLSAILFLIEFEINISIVVIEFVILLLLLENKLFNLFSIKFIFILCLLPWLLVEKTSSFIILLFFLIENFFLILNNKFSFENFLKKNQKNKSFKNKLIS
jgi:hypothetical protein